MRLISLVLGMLVIPSLVLATTHYVGQSASGAGTGTSPSNLCGGLADQDCAQSAGDVVYLCGAFTTALSVPTSGTTESPITYEWDCPSAPATMTFDASSQFAFSVSGKHDLVINHLRIQGAAEQSGPTNQEALVFIGNTSYAITLNDPTVWGNSYKSGMYITNAYDVTVNRLTAYNNTWYGAYVYTGTHDIHFDTFTTYNNVRAGIFFLGATQAGNYDNWAKNGTSYSNGDGLYAAIARDILFQDNHLYSNTNQAGSGEGYGIGVQQVLRMHVIGNTIHGNRTDGVEAWGDAQWSSDDCEVAYNTIYDHASGIDDQTAFNGIEERTGYAKGCRIYRNLLYNNNRNFRLGNDASNRSILYQNVALTGLYSVRAVDSNESGTNSLTGWRIAYNTFSGPSVSWFSTDVASGNSNTFLYNVWDVTSTATYNGVEYTPETITTLDSTGRATSAAPSITGAYGTLAPRVYPLPSDYVFARSPRLLPATPAGPRLPAGPRTPRG